MVSAYKQHSSPCLSGRQQGNRSKQELEQLEPLLHQLPNHVENKQIVVLSAHTIKLLLGHA